MILVTGSVVARAEGFDELLAASLEHVERSRKEPGCLEHGVYRDAENPLRLVFVERWTDRQALAVHFALPATRAFARTIGELAAEQPELEVYDAAPLPPQNMRDSRRQRKDQNHKQEVPEKSQ